MRLHKAFYYFYAAIEYDSEKLKTKQKSIQFPQRGTNGVGVRRALTIRVSLAYRFVTRAHKFSLSKNERRKKMFALFSIYSSPFPNQRSLRRQFGFNIPCTHIIPTHPGIVFRSVNLRYFRKKFFSSFEKKKKKKPEAKKKAELHFHGYNIFFLL